MIPHVGSFCCVGNFESPLIQSMKLLQSSPREASVSRYHNFFFNIKRNKPLRATLQSMKYTVAIWYRAVWGGLLLGWEAWVFRNCAWNLSMKLLQWSSGEASVCRYHELLYTEPLFNLCCTPWQYGTEGCEGALNWAPLCREAWVFRNSSSGFDLTLNWPTWKRRKKS